MKKYAKYIEWVVALVLLLVPCLVFANFTVGISDSDLMNFTPPKGDLSVSLLASIFGSVPAVTQLMTAGQTIMGKLFGIFNAGVLGISGVFLGYTTFNIITKSMADGSAMSSSSTMWTAVRVGSSVAMLVPGVTGYSAINAFVMWIVIQSIGLADMTWGAALDYLKTGAPVSILTSTPEVDYSLVNYSLGAPGTTAETNVGAADVLRSLVCAYTIKDALKRYPGTTSQNISEFLIYKDIAWPSNVPISTPSTAGGYYQFPYVEREDVIPKNDPSATNKYPFVNYGITIPATVGKITGICGTIGYTLSKVQKDALKDQDYKNTMDAYMPAKRNGLQSMIGILDPIAQQLVSQAGADLSNNNKRTLDPDNYIVVQKKGVDSKFYSGSQITEFVDPPTSKSILDQTYEKIVEDAQSIKWPIGASDMLNAAAGYQIALSGPRSTNFVKVEAKAKDIYETAKDKGWILAGSYYTLLQQQITTQTLVDSFFRLTAYSTDNVSGVVTETTIADASKNRPWKPSNALFTDYADGAPQAPSLLRSLFKALDVSGEAKTSIVDNSALSSNETLRRAFAWIYFSYPYAKILGKTLVIPTQAGIGSKSISLSYNGDSEGDINSRVLRGSICVAIPFAALVGIIYLKDAPMRYLQYDINEIMNKWNEVMGSSTLKDPIVKLQALGRSMIEHSVAFFGQIERILIYTSTAFMIQGAIELILVACVGIGSFWGTTTGTTIALQTMQSVSASINEIVRTIIFMYVPMGLAVTGPLLVTGAILAVYVPLIPYMLFLFGVMSWFISVLILMAAAPIICFLMLWGAASQENPLLSREAEQFVQQIISIFFKPTLMVVGLVVGVVLARIGVDLLNAGFQIVLNNVFVGSGNDTVKMIEQIGSVVIYTFIMISLVNICFSTIHLLHSEVMGVIGIRVSAGGMEEKAMGEVKAGATEFAQAGAAGAKEQATALKGLQTAAPKARDAGEVLKSRNKEKPKPEKSV
ncbi:putative Organelle trafficking lipoprotein defect DotA [Gammaproteobacteria bacterium]